MRKHIIYSVELDGLIPRMSSLTRLNPEGYFIQPMIDRAGHRVVFWGKAEGETGFNIWICATDGTQRLKLTEDRAISGHPFWSADGRQIVYFSSVGASDTTDWEMANQFGVDRPPRNLWIMDRDGGNRRRLTTGPYTDERPCLSPNGREIVFVSNRSGHLNLWRLEPETDALTQLTDHKGLDYRPIFSPDGQWLAFFSDDNPQNRHDLCLLELGTGEVYWPVPQGLFKWIHGAFWLPDGDTILFHAKPVNGPVALWTFRMSSGRIDRLDLPGLPTYAHGSVDRNLSVLIFDSSFEPDPLPAL